MKDLGPTQQILGIIISRDSKKSKLWLSQNNYIKNVLERFYTVNSKLMSTQHASHFKFNLK